MLGAAQENGIAVRAGVRDRGATSYSIGKWRGTDNDGTHDTLEIETRAMKGLCLMDNSSIPGAPYT